MNIQMTSGRVNQQPQNRVAFGSYSTTVCPEDLMIMSKGLSDTLVKLEQKFAPSENVQVHTFVDESKGLLWAVVSKTSELYNALKLKNSMPKAFSVPLASTGEDLAQQVETQAQKIEQKALNIKA
jgi:hypothetical protein